MFDATDSIELDLAGHLSQVDFGHMYLVRFPPCDKMSTRLQFDFKLPTD